MPYLDFIEKHVFPVSKTGFRFELLNHHGTLFLHTYSWKTELSAGVKTVPVREVWLPVPRSKCRRKGRFLFPRVPFCQVRDLVIRVAAVESAVSCLTVSFFWLSRGAALAEVAALWPLSGSRC